MWNMRQQNVKVHMWNSAEVSLRVWGQRWTPEDLWMFDRNRWVPLPDPWDARAMWRCVRRAHGPQDIAWLDITGDPPYAFLMHCCMVCASCGSLGGAHLFLLGIHVSSGVHRCLQAWGDVPALFHIWTIWIILYPHVYHCMLDISSAALYILIYCQP